MKLIIKKSDFPILKDKKLIYLDSSATAIKPKSVVEAEEDYYFNYSANIHRGMYGLSEKATEKYEEARRSVSQFLGGDEDELIFVRNATEGINLVAFTWAEKNLKKGDRILASVMEHHSNFIPWQRFCRMNDIHFDVCDVTKEGLLNISDFKRKISKKTKLVAITHASNVLGTINPVAEICKIAHQNGALVIVDGAQAAPHLKVDVGALGCDFYAVSAHKMMGPTGIGALWVRKKILDKMEPFMVGGGIVSDVSIRKTDFSESVDRFEAGTPNIAGAIGFAAAVNYLSKIGMKRVESYERELTEYAIKKFSQIKNLKILGSNDSKNRLALISFVVEGIHPHDIASFLDEQGICVRAGHHCALPLHKRLNIPASTRASFYVYNDKKDVDKIVAGIKKAKNLLITNN